MNFVGVDLHKHTITLVVVDASRKMLSRRRFTNLMSEQIVAFLKSQGEFQLTVEATASYEWFVQLVEPLTQRVVLAHPGKLRVIAESTRKSDKLDAKVLAEMLALDQIPASYRPTPRQRAHRQLVRQRQFWQRKITGVRNKIRRILSDYNLDRSDLFTEVGQAWLKTAAVSDVDRFCLDQLVDEWTGLIERLQAVDKQVREFAKSGSDQEQFDRALLRTIPGVGPVTSEVVLAELADPRRFSSLKKVVAYAGLAPGQRESAGKRKSLHIEKTGSPLLRWVLVQAAWQLVKRSPKWRAIYENLKRRIGTKKAIVAVSRRLLTLCVTLLKNQQVYREITVSPASTAGSSPPVKPAQART
ncbi:MAG: Transposase [Schlesneria sp.]|nr:Transposase [Schlesneria sp.]